MKYYPYIYIVSRPSSRTQTRACTNWTSTILRHILFKFVIGACSFHRRTHSNCLCSLQLS